MHPLSHVGRMGHETDPTKCPVGNGGGSFLARTGQETQQGNVNKAKNSFFGKLGGAGCHKEEIRNIYSSLTWPKPGSCMFSDPGTEVCESLSTMSAAARNFDRHRFHYHFVLKHFVIPILRFLL